MRFIESRLGKNRNDIKTFSEDIQDDLNMLSNLNGQLRKLFAKENSSTQELSLKEISSVVDQQSLGIGEF